MEKIIDLEERIPTFREKRRKRTNFKFSVLIAIFVVVICILLYFQSSISNVKKIEISGATIRDKAYYEEQLQFKIGDSMWAFKAEDIQNKLEQFPWVKEVSVNRKLLNTVKVEVNEWLKVAYIAEHGSFYPVLENGEVLRDEVEMVPIDAPIFNAIEDEALRKRLLAELGKLDKEVLSMISQIALVDSPDDKYAITLFMNDGYEVRADLTTLAEKLNYYPSIVAQIGTEQRVEKGIIDIEVGTYYKAYSDVYIELSMHKKSGASSTVQEDGNDDEELDQSTSDETAEQDEGQQDTESETEGSDAS